MVALFPWDQQSHFHTPEMPVSERPGATIQLEQDGLVAADDTCLDEDTLLRWKTTTFKQSWRRWRLVDGSFPTVRYLVV